MAEILRFKAALNPRGAWDASTAYAKLDVVESGGSSYVCLQACTGTQVTNTTYWHLIAAKGAQGNPLTYADLTAAQKAELVQDATASAQQAAASAQTAAGSAQTASQALTTIQSAIDDLDPSQSADDAVVALAARQGVLEADLSALGPKIDYGAIANINFASGTVINKYIDVNQNWKSHATASYLFVGTNGGTLHIVPNENGTRVVFAKSIFPSAEESKEGLISTYLATYDTGTDKIYYEISSETTLDIPSDASVIGFLRTTTTGIDRLPTLAQMPKYAIYKSSVRDDIDYIANVIGSISVIPLIEDGAIASTTGIPTSSTTRLRTKTFIKATTINISVGASVKYYVFGYDANGNYVAADSSSWRTTNAKVSINGCSMYKIVFAYTDNSTISSSDFAELGVEINVENSNNKKVLTKSDVVNNLTTGGADAPLSAEAGKELNSQINGIYNELNLSQYTEYNAVIETAQRKNWFIQSVSRCLCIPVISGSLFRIIGRSDGRSVWVAFLKNLNNINNSGHPASFAAGQVLITVTSGEVVTLTVPSDANYLYVCKYYSSERLPSSISILTEKGVRQEVDEIKQGINVSLDKEELVHLASVIGNKLNPSTYQLDTNGYEIPMTRQQLFAIWKSQQLSSIKWTPLLDVPKPGGGSFTAGVEVTGLPYSSTKEIDKYVGFDVSIHTFMTAVNNPYSLLYTENISAANSQSAWGKTYHGGGPNPARTYYGVVCSVFAAYCSGLLQQWSTDEDAWLRNYKLKFSKNYDQSAQGLMIGDIYWRNGHNRVIAGLKRDASGNVTHVYVSEAVTPTVGVTLYTAAQFDAKTASENGVLYRNLELYKNKYTPSEFVAAGDESVPSPTYNDDICTFAGDKATFREGDIIVIDYNLKSVGSWTQMELYKDDLLIDTITIDTSFHYVNLTSRNLSYGRYKARMKNGNDNVSDFTYWEIIQADVAIQTNDNDTHTISWTSANGKALSIIVCDISGIVYAHDEFSEEVTNDNSITIDLYKLNREQYPSDKFASSGMYLKVSFIGQYGRVTNEPIEVSL